MTTQRVAEPDGLEAEGVGVEPVPAAGRGWADRRQARPEDRSHRTGEGERDRAVGSQSCAGGGRDERLGKAADREPAQPSRLRQLLPGSWHRGDRDASHPLPPCRDHPDVNRPASSGEAQRPCVTVLPQHNRPHRRLEGRDDRLARSNLEPAATEPCARRAHEAAGPRGTPDQPACPPRTTNRQLHSQRFTGNERRLGPHSPLPNANRDRAAIGPTDDHARNTSRIPGLHEVGERLAVQLDTWVRPQEQSPSGGDSAGKKHQPRSPEAHPGSRPPAPRAPDRL